VIVDIATPASADAGLNMGDKGYCTSTVAQKWYIKLNYAHLYMLFYNFAKFRFL
jgi:hypothetical protein